MRRFNSEYTEFILSPTQLKPGGSRSGIYGNMIGREEGRKEGEISEGRGIEKEMGLKQSCTNAQWVCGFCA